MKSEDYSNKEDYSSFKQLYFDFAERAGYSKMKKAYQLEFPFIEDIKKSSYQNSRQLEFYFVKKDF
ncbi:MAG: hypothetical protein QW273_02760 [Candidatus Pacearchaeota archaeon]